MALEKNRVKRTCWAFRAIFFCLFILLPFLAFSHLVDDVLLLRPPSVLDLKRNLLHLVVEINARLLMRLGHKFMDACIVAK